MSELSEFNDAVAIVIDRADKLCHRENTDFFGRMSQTLMEAQSLSEDGATIEPKDAEEYRDAMLELAALALAQAAMMRPTP